MDLDECINVYQQLGDRVFRNLKTLIPISVVGRLKARYSHEALVASVKSMITRQGMNEDELLQENPGTLLPVTYGIVLSIRFCKCLSVLPELFLLAE